jgi:hypothetical protein
MDIYIYAYICVYGYVFDEGWHRYIGMKYTYTNYRCTLIHASTYIRIHLSAYAHIYTQIKIICFLKLCVFYENIHVFRLLLRSVQAIVTKGD